MLVALKTENPNRPGLSYTRQWTKSLPFCINPRGQLIHRVRMLRTHLTKDGKPRHNSYTYWCGNATTAACELSSNPPENVLLCERCEAIAVNHGEKSASELAGRHVHVGRLVPIRSCCTHDN